MQEKAVWTKITNLSLKFPLNKLEDCFKAVFNSNLVRFKTNK